MRFRRDLGVIWGGSKVNEGDRGGSRWEYRSGWGQVQHGDARDGSRGDGKSLHVLVNWGPEGE